MTIKLVGEPRTATTRWLYRYFRGEAERQAFVRHFSGGYRSSKGTRIPVNNVYSRILRDERRGLIIRDPD